MVARGGWSEYYFCSDRFPIGPISNCSDRFTFVRIDFHFLFGSISIFCSDLPISIRVGDRQTFASDFNELSVRSSLLLGGANRQLREAPHDAYFSSRPLGRCTPNTAAGGGLMVNSWKQNAVGEWWPRIMVEPRKEIGRNTYANENGSPLHSDR